MAEKNPRSRARELAVAALYRFDLVNEAVEECLDEVRRKRSYPREVRDYACKLISETTLNLVAVDHQIQQSLKGWEFLRLSPVERAVLRMATWELLYSPDVPPKVSINEAVEIAKRYGTEGSAKFVNAVLDTIYQRKKNENPNHYADRSLLRSPRQP